MPYNEHLADRIRRIFQEKKVHFVEKRMMGGLCFMANDKMCVGILKEDLMVRINPDIDTGSLHKEYHRPMDLTGKSMKGFLFVNPEGTDLDHDLEYWVQLALDYNPFARASKKRKSHK